MRSDQTDRVVIVDETDLPIGVADKLSAHTGDGVLHRAVSACLFDIDGRFLVQRRAVAKYHFAGRWSNSCCTHPRPGESPAEAIVRRLDEELGVRAHDLEWVGAFIYRAVDAGSGFVEHELDHVYVGRLIDTPVPNPAEVMDWQLVHPERANLVDWRGPAYTPWLLDVLWTAGAVVRPSDERDVYAPARTPRPG
jgi:isopentenyl-diphosphate Delta-isomerase